MQQYPDIAGLDAELFGDLSVAHIVEVSQTEDLCFLCWKPAQRRSQLDGRFSGLYLLGGFGAFGGQNGQVRGLELVLRVANPSAQVVYRTGSSDVDQQSGKISHVLASRKFQGANKGFLEAVGCIFVISE